MNLKVGRAVVLSREYVASDNFYQEGGVAVFKGDLVIIVVGHTFLARQGTPLTVVAVNDFNHDLVERLTRCHPEARLPANDAEHRRIVGKPYKLRVVSGQCDEAYWRFVGAASVQAL